MNKYNHLASNTILISLGTVGSKLLVFLMVRFYTGYLTPADYGTADLLTQTANLLIPVFSLSIADGVFRYAMDSETEKSGAFSAGLYVILAGSLLLFALIPVMNLVPVVHGYGVFVAIFVSASCFHSLCSQLLRATGKMTLFAIQGLLNTGLVIAFNVLFLAVFGLGIVGYVMSVAVANLFCAAFLAWKEKLWKLTVRRPKKGLLLKMLRYSIPLIPTTAFWWVTGVSDRYMVNAFLGTEATGIYSVAYKIPTILTILSTVFMYAWQFSAVAESGSDKEQFLHFYSKVWNAFQGGLFVCNALIISFAQFEIRALATPGYYAAWQYIPLLSLAMVFASFTNFMGSVYIVTKKSLSTLWTAMVGAVVNVALNLLLIPSPLGMQGAAFATMFAYLAVFAIRVINVRASMPFRLFLPKVAASLVLSGIQAVSLLWHFPLQPMIQALCSLCIFAINYRPMVATIRQIKQPIQEKIFQRRLP